MEVNTYRKNPSKVVARTAYVYPSTYKAMISGLSTDIIYGILNRIDEVYVERFACSSLYGPEDPRSLETGSRLKEFPLILTSIHYEPDIVNLARMLLSGGISALSKNREKHVVIAGGPACMSNPVPYSDIVDACVIGEAEVSLAEIVSRWLEYGDDKRRFLEEIASLNYVYVPGITSGTVTRVYAKNLDEVYYPIRQVENTEIEPVYGRGFKLEVSRGCLFWCSFCIETRIFQPYRERSLGTLKTLLEKGLNYTIGGKRVLLFALVFPVTPTHYGLLEHLRNEGYKASIPSLRVTPYLEKSLEIIHDLGQRSLTIAPESLSPALQSIISKYTGILDYVYQVIEEIINAGFDIKLYLIYGFKGFEDIELDANIEHLTKLAKKAKHAKRRLTISFNPLVPKPQTLFQWVGMLPRDRLVSVLREYRNALKGLVETRTYDIDLAIVQAQLALSPRPLGVFVEQWAMYGGGLAGWRKAVKRLGLNYKYIFTGYNHELELPWSFVKSNAHCEKVNEAQYAVYRKLARVP